MKFGVYSACAFNPLHLRLMMLQLKFQTLQPDYIAVHENGIPEPFMKWSCKDIQLKGKLLYKHTPNMVRKSARQLPALQMLLGTDCEYFVKTDIDDFFHSTWLQTLVGRIKGTDYDWVINRNNSVCLMQMPDFDPTEVDAPSYAVPRIYYWPKVDFGKINPLGGMSDNIIFNRKVAEMYAKALEMMPDTADDTTLFNILPSFPKGKKVDGDVDVCYISHGRNASSAIWQTYVPDL